MASNDVFKHQGDVDYQASWRDNTGLILIPRTFPELLTSRYLTDPNQLAIDSHVRQWTYAQLTRDVQTVSEVLRQRGVDPGHNVGLCFDLSPWAVVAILASMSIGAAVVPVYPFHPKPRKMTMFHEADVKFVIVEDHHSGKDLNDSGHATIKLMDIDFDTTPKSPFHPISEPVDPAFIAFTSGTTGPPKGIVQTQQAIVTMSTALALSLGVNRSSRVSQLHPYVFDVSVMEIGMCLVSGATLCLTQKGDMMLPSAGELGPELTRSRITHTTLSPTMLNMMDPVDVPTLRVLSVMGEPLSRSAVQKWATCRSRLFYQLWGATEGCILQTMTPPIVGNQHPQNIGRAIPGACRIWITDMDSVDVLVEDGCVGQIVIESRALATGYIGKPEETNRVFLDNVVWQDHESSGRLYRTGDLGRRDPDGTIVFLGRNDCQINFHGERLELGEIDHHLQRCRPEAVRDCFAEFDEARQIVIGFASSARISRGHVKPCEFMTRWSDATITKNTMVQFTERLLLDGELPDYMIPRFWIPIRARPLTASGKTDRSVLKSLIRGMSALQWDEFEVRSATSTLYHY